MEESLPPGFRFHPTDEELITYYLTPKVSNTSFSSRAIADVDLNKCEPWDLPGKASMGEKEWYFFSLRDRKYPTGIRTNRATEAGYWKTTGKDKEIYRGGMLVGMKKTLVFYKGRAPKGEKSNWVMHEYRMETKHSFKPKKEEWVVCRVFKKSSAVKKPHQLTTGQSSLPSLESPCDTNTNISEFGDIELPSGFNNNTNTNYVNGGDHDNLNMNNLNWVASASASAAAAAGREGTAMVPSVLPWPSSLLSPNLEMNSLLIKALQLGSYRPREATNGADHQNYSYLPVQGISNFGNTTSATTDHLICSNFQPPPSSSSSSFKVLDYSLHQHQHQHQLQQHQEEQPFNLDSINW